jgi:Xaa-Pro dipeptidase
MDLKAIQSALREQNFDAWLFYDHHHRDAIAYSVLGLRGDTLVSRRWFYLIPAQGDPAKLVHRIEAGHLDELPGGKHVYSGWQELGEKLKSILSPYKKVAMQYSPNNLVPQIGLVDAGTVEMVRSFGNEVVSSGNLVSQFEAALNDDQIKSHFEARDAIDQIMEAAFKEAGRRLRNGGTHEWEIASFINEAFEREGLITEDPVIVAVNKNAANPHYEPRADLTSPIREGDLLLLDLFGKKKRPGAVYYDITWVGFIGQPSEKHREVFEVVRDARDVGINTVLEAFKEKRKIAGWEVDKATREFITSKGYGEYFVHRTGHSIGPHIHGNGANMDYLETKDERQIIPNTLFSIEPGVYLPEFGVRCEVNVLTRRDSAEVTGRIQKEFVLV